MINFCELEGIGEEVAVTYFKVIIWPSPRGTEEFPEKTSVRIFISASLKIEGLPIVS
jgi:hypothetical protein